MDAVATKFCSSLVKSLQILCNGHLDFSDGIELIGHINIKVDNKLKLNYVLDEQVSKQNDDSTTFCSNSYHSAPPSRQNSIKSSETEDGLLQSLPPPLLKSKTHTSEFSSGQESQRDFSVDVSESVGDDETVTFVKEEKNEEVMVLSEAAEPSVGNVNMAHTEIAASSTRNESFLPLIELQKASDTSVSNVSKDQEKKIPGDIEASYQRLEAVDDIKQLISKLTDLCDLAVIQNFMKGSKTAPAIKSYPEEDLAAAKKKLLQSIDKSHIQKLKNILQERKGPRRKQEIKTLLAEMGLSNDQLFLLASDVSYQRKFNSRGMFENQSKKDPSRENRKSFRMRTQERQERLLEMAETLKRSHLSESGLTVLSKNGGKKCTLFKSSVSVVSHNTKQLSMENIDEAIDLLSNRSPFSQKRVDNKPKDALKVEPHKRHVVKRKMKQILNKMLDEVVDSGYRAVLSSSAGSETGSQTAEVSVIPLNVDELYPENRNVDMKSEMTEEEYAKHLEREQFIEKQKNMEDKMKEMEEKLNRILSGADEIFVPSRKRYAPGESRPTDAERMKEYRKKLKEDPEKYQVYKQKRALSKKRRRLSALAAKLKEAGSNSQGMSNKPASEASHDSQSMGSLVTITQPSVGAVGMHCSQVYGHPNSHQSVAVSVHHNNQFVGQVSNMHTSHQQPISYGNEMDIVELIAATHNVQNQHF